MRSPTVAVHKNPKPLKENRPEKRIEPANLFYIIYVIKSSKAQFRYVFLQQKTGKNKAPFQMERGLAYSAIQKINRLFKRREESLEPRDI